MTVTGDVDVLPDAYTLEEDSVLAVPAATGVLNNDGTQGQSLTATVVSQPSHGTLTFNADGSFTYTPNDDFSGVDSFTYTATDGTLTGNTATVTINVTAVNDPPTGVADAYATNEDTPLTVNAANGVLKNDSDPDNDALTVEVATGPAHGTLQLNADGSFVYTPTADYNGTDTFTYRIKDGTHTSDPITVTLTINAVNEPPVAVADSYTVNEDTTLTVTVDNGVLKNDTDVENDAMTVEVVQQPAYGTLTLNANGSFTYVPLANFYGAVTFTYRAKDASGQSQPITVTITINNVNDAPVTVADAQTVTNSGATHEIDVLANDTPGPVVTGGQNENGPLTITAVTQGSQGGTVTISSDGSKVLYKPAATFTGTETFTYTIKDPEGLTKTGTVTMTVNTAATTGVISGYVYFDADNDGVRDTGEMGVPGVLITITSTSTGTNVSRSAITKNDGTYSFTGLPAGTYKIVQSQPMALNDGEEKSSSTGATITNDQIANVVLTSTGTVANNNFGERLLKPGYTSIRWFFASSQTNNTFFREVIAKGEENAGNTSLAQAIRNGDTTYTAPASGAATASASVASLMAEEESTNNAAASAFAFAALVEEEESDNDDGIVDREIPADDSSSRNSATDPAPTIYDDAEWLDGAGDESEEEIEALDEAFADLSSWQAA